MSESLRKQILLVEDHPGDITLTRRAFQRLSTPNDLHVVVDGVEAMAFLQQVGRFTDAPRPDLMLLDLNMPRKDGREVLREVALDVVLKTIPIIILTTSSAEHEVASAYTLCANSYIVKPVSFEDFMGVIKAIESYWFGTALIPK